MGMKLHLIEDWRRAWRWSSVRLAVIAGAATGWVATDPAGFQRAVDLLPEWVRPVLGVIVAVSAISARVTTKHGGRNDDRPR